jgi:hypothetical protein
MAKVTENDITRGISGAVTKDLIFRRDPSGDTVVYKKPKKRAAQTEEQIAVVQKFSQAADYATAELSDPLLKEEYLAIAAEKGIKDVRRLIMTDYLRNPIVELINPEEYTGAVNDTIFIKAKAVFKVVSVFVEIRTADGTVVESGEAVASPRFFNFEYKAKTAIANFAGYTIKVTATGKPRNKGFKEIVL